ncbi:hypothetical protein DES41_105387 [Pseudorhodoferax soli]|uniref:Uncharacterized protein n=1 Tax=Pseudorhodoferax soli TaxID=545864 RepID=A0A368XWN6_9BURK|nr:hypothetical protein DES41_105387 [Pseudorhodoferax soli]
MKAPTTPSGRAKRRPEPQAERSDGPCGTSPCAPAEERSAMGCAGNLALRELTHCACPSVVSGANGASCAMQPMARAPQVARSASAGTGAPGSPSLWLLSLGEARESDCAAGRTSRLQVLARKQSVLCTPSADQSEEAGYSPPHGDSLFLLRQEKEAKEGGPGAHVPPLALRATCGARGLGALHNSHHSLRSFSSDKCNESVHEARGSPRRPGHCAPRRGHRGGSGVTYGPSLRSAAPPFALRAIQHHGTSTCK